MGRERTRERFGSIGAGLALLIAGACGASATGPGGPTAVIRAYAVAPDPGHARPDPGHARPDPGHALKAGQHAVVGHAAARVLRRVATPAPAGVTAGVTSDGARYWVRCEDMQHCPEAVGMLVAPARPEAERCTVALVAPDRVLTASHCLPASARRPGASCEGLWVAFPGTRTQAAVVRACAEVVAATDLPRAGVLRQEYALMRLSARVERRALEVDRSPLSPRSIVTVVSVTPHPAIATRHSLTSRLCRVEGQDEAVQALGDQARAVGWLTHCPIEHGNSGSPVLDYQGRLRAIVHGGTFTGYARGVTSLPPLLR